MDVEGGTNFFMIDLIKEQSFRHTEYITLFFEMK